MIEIRFYGKLRDIFGDKLLVKEKINTIDEILKFLAEKDKTVEKIKEYLLFSINKKQASREDGINNGDEIAIFVTPTGG